MNNYNSEPTGTCEGVVTATIVDFERELHGNLIEMRELLKSYIERMYGKAPEGNDTSGEPKCLIEAMAHDAHLSANVMRLLKDLCEGLGV